MKKNKELTKILRNQCFLRSLCNWIIVIGLIGLAKMLQIHRVINSSMDFKPSQYFFTIMAIIIAIYEIFRKKKNKLYYS